MLERHLVRRASWIVLLGIWAMLAPFMLGYGVAPVRRAAAARRGNQPGPIFTAGS